MWYKKILGIIFLAIFAFSPLAVTAEISDKTSELDKGTVAKSTTGSYIIVMEEMPLILTEGRDQLNTEQAQENGQELIAEHERILQEAGIHSDLKTNSYTIALNGFSVIMSHEQAQKVAMMEGVARVIPDEMRYPHTNATPKFLGLTSSGGAYRTGFDGEGVIIGVIDTGIWPEHPSFEDDGSYSDLGIVLDNSRPNCEFGNTSHNSNDAPFECNNKLLGARQMLDAYRFFFGVDEFEYDSARDDSGHGTHAASTAGGNADIRAEIFGVRLGKISGIAPRARIIAYKVSGNLAALTSDVVAAIDQAVADGVDVISYSFGSPPSSPGVDEVSFLFAENAGVFVAVSVGNAGPGESTVGTPGTVPWVTTVGASTQPKFHQGIIKPVRMNRIKGASIKAPNTNFFKKRRPLVDAEFAGNEFCLPGTLDSSVEGKIVLCRRGEIARIAKSKEVFEKGGIGMILYNDSDIEDLISETHWVPTVHIDNTPGLALKDYIASDSNPKASIRWRSSGFWPSAPSMVQFSGRGPNSISPDIIKPDLTAPGSHVLAGFSPTPHPSNNNVPGQLFQALTGTSMSAPHVAGLFALIKQAHPDWSPAMAKSALMTTARIDVVDNDRKTLADPFDMGSGQAYPGKVVRKGSAFQPGLVYNAGLFEYAAYTCGEDFGIFTPGSCDFLESIGVPSEPYNLNYPSIGVSEVPGAITVTRTVTSVAKEKGWRTYRVSVEAPEGYNVDVSPSKLKLKSGDTATYSVTFTNDGTAPIGEWRHGALIWEDKTGHYSVRSPISLKGILFQFPEDDLVLDGVSGSGSLDVAFGYTGNYTAAPHGLEPAVVTSDNVVQDPGGIFDPSDGFSNLHQFNLSGTAHFRIRIPPEATEVGADLDVYVYDPDGNFFASSTNPFTNEQVDIPLPADGTWSVYVHGFTTPGGDSDYDMYTWDISQTPGGNLTIDNAPSSATIGATGTVEFSWSGATSGQWHLGGISHTGDVGLMGITLIDVDNR